MKQQVDETVGWWNIKLMKLQVDQIANLLVDETTYGLNDKLMKQEVDKMAT